METMTFSCFEEPSSDSLTLWLIFSILFKRVVLKVNVELPKNKKKKKKRRKEKGEEKREK